LPWVYDVPPDSAITATMGNRSVDLVRPEADIAPLFAQKRNVQGVPDYIRCGNFPDGSRRRDLRHRWTDP
jgi:hypothetical protein